MKKLFFFILLFHFSLVGQDLQLEWGIQIGTSINTDIVTIEVDEFNNTYVAGNYSGEILGDAASGLVGNQSTNTRSFIAKYDENGIVLWAHSFEGTGTVNVHDLKILDNGNLVMSGVYYGSVDFDLKLSEYLVSSAQSNIGQAFVMVVTQDGDFQWCKTFTGAQMVIAGAISSNNVNELYIGFYFRGYVDFDPGVNEFFLSSANSDFNSALVKLSESGDFIWAKLFESSGYSIVKSIEVDHLGSCYIALLNFPSQLDCDPSLSSAIVNFTGLNNGILISLDNEGNYLWHFTPTTVNGSYINNIHINNGELYFGGHFTNEINYTIAGQNILAQSVGNENGFLFKCSLSGEISWCNTMGSHDNLRPLALGSSEDGSKIYVGGYFINSFINPVSQENLEVVGNSHNAFLLSYTSSGENIESIPFEMESFTALQSIGVIGVDELVLSIKFSNQITLFNELNPVSAFALNDVYIFRLKICPSFNTTITQVGSELMVGEQDINYQWFNCANTTDILSEINQSYHLLENGIYAVILEDNGCIDTSECIVISDLGIFSNELHFELSPNPSENYLLIYSTFPDHFFIHDQTGRYIGECYVHEKKIIETENFQNGIYYISSATKGSVIKFVKI